MPLLEDYAPIVGQDVIDDLRLLSERLRGRTVRNVNSTAVGGGVAEILNRLVPLLRQVGVEASWDVIKGGDAFFAVTKKIHNALHGGGEGLTPQDKEIFMETSRANMEAVDTGADIMFIHDPQPMALVARKRENKWIWRCHVDVSRPEPGTWDFLMSFIGGYDASVFSAPQFSRELPLRQFQIAPSIDPLSDKNRDLEPGFIDSVMEKHSIPRDKPVVTQISRFDRLKDPLGVIEAWRLVKKYIDCRLVLAGGGAADDPEGMQVYAEVMERAKGDPDLHILLMKQDDLEVNALQRASDIVIQKSLKEGFGLTVSEALWKGKPVVASAVGGIPLQVAHKHSGLLCHSVEGAAFALKQLLNSPDYARKLGENGREHVRRNFLLTRHLKEYMLLFLALDRGEDLVNI
ncbi:MAG: glycosyltransferase [Elusimicrobiales bacterium]|jgi:trehalose synthase|nr:glycosyltransferase [Elusimicrobiales bacterium]